MVKVNEEKVLQDYKELVAKKQDNLAKIEADAKVYAQTHGYDEEKTAKFVKFTQEIEGNGLSVEETAKLELLLSYIEEVDETELKLNIVSDGEVVAENTTSENATVTSF